MNLADKGARVGNFIIDSIVFVIIQAFVAIIIYLLSPEFLEDDNTAAIYVVVLYCSYYFVLEYCFGRTPGKWITKTKIISANGDRPSFAAVLFRSLLRLLPFDGVSFLLGQVGLHDTLTKTTVVYTKKIIPAI
jgi:uncharacterized RDD family membrane protein YckC